MWEDWPEYNDCWVPRPRIGNVLHDYQQIDPEYRFHATQKIHVSIVIVRFVDVIFNANYDVVLERLRMALQHGTEFILAVDVLSDHCFVDFSKIWVIR